MPPKQAKRRLSFAPLRNWYARFERPISSISLVGGFVFDALTLRRIDAFWDNFWVGGHLAIVAAAIILVNRGEHGEIDTDDPAKLHFWFVNVLQFFFGGLLSTFLVFYFRSGTIWVSWPFFLLLAAAFIANESFKRRYARLDFQISLFFLSLFSFAAYLVPILTHRIGQNQFLISGGVSLALLGLFLLVLRFAAKEKFRRGRLTLFLSIIGIYAAMNAFYFLNIIPPLPLSLADSGVYHSLMRNADGHYVVQAEPGSWLDFLDVAQTVHLIPGDPLYAYSAVFSPADLNTDIIHEWQKYDTSSGQWATRAKIALSVVGGRDGGYHTYSEATAPAGGEWRVNVETPDGKIIGRLQFNVVLQSSEPPLVTDIKQ
ncbi:MAG TPA: DUF2914 domain-containing protein [Candidatus Paceibacterota bacterium]|nr:DUF2914 domain-containing protein [Candidatus Paceibacterota bacterium]